MAIWTVKTHYKKNVQEVEHWVRSKGEGKIIVTNGFRWGEWTVETSDDNPPEFEFDFVPGGDGKKDSINMLGCEINNIESVELVSMDDGGCWYDIEFEGLTLEEEEELQEFIDENSVYDLEDRDEDAWYNDETEWWIWGPIEIQDEEGNTIRIICADEDGNLIDFKED
jgi:hypothetical protein